MIGNVPMFMVKRQDATRMVKFFRGPDRMGIVIPQDALSRGCMQCQRVPNAMWYGV